MLRRPTSRRPFAAGCALLLALAALSGACASSDVRMIPAPPSVAETTTTVPFDKAAVALPAVPGETTTTIAVGPGRAVLQGTLAGPEGPVAGGVVRAERIVGSASATVDAVTQPDGTWKLETLLGGRWRVRAFRAPDLAMTAPEIFFLEASETKTLNLAVQPFAGLEVGSAIAPDPPFIDEPANLVIQVVQRSVDDQGVVRGVPVPNVFVELFGSGDWQLQSTNPVVTDGAGHAEFRLVCRRAGEQPLSVVVADTQTFPVAVPPCGVRPPTEGEGGGAVSTSSTTSTTSRSTTSTTRGPTSTTRPTSTTTTTDGG